MSSSLFGTLLLRKLRNLGFIENNPSKEGLFFFVFPHWHQLNITPFLVYRKKLTKEQFIERSRLVHGDKYSYSRGQYTNNRDKVIIICPTRGEFLQAPNKHLANRGCPECGKITRGDKRRSDTLSFIEKAKRVHGERYDYSRVDYKTAILPVEIICPKHGPFLQKPNVHLNGHGCTLCDRDVNSLDKESSTLKFIEKAKKIHGDKYDYSKVDYHYASQKVTIRRNKCGHVFKQRPNGLPV